MLLRGAVRAQGVCCFFPTNSVPEDSKLHILCTNNSLRGVLGILAVESSAVLTLAYTSFKGLGVAAFRILALQKFC